MTAQRQQRNWSWSKPLFCRVIAAIALAALLMPPVALRAATTQRIISDRFSGLAIDGFDPVSYFVDGKALLGLPDYEASQGGVVWRFRNEGNRASFLAHPEVYGPQFGGYDPTDVARGVTVAGNPRFFAVVEDRLFLFNREDSRDAFKADPARYLAKAEARWPALQEDLPQ
ncbi:MULTISPECIES: YHS domain-containing (seleno)protein [unclassified Bradyrhizobium]|uniref:YHS domain-containing (seleno)protein n=1 Tax=unclassified Bradyrhizobium TaxID=2631580 RepID=UPI0028E8E553|nr:MULTISPECIES: YHS domain-containing (seleno)protein [unclassified Bradyrhizobium]